MFKDPLKTKRIRRSVARVLYRSSLGILLCIMLALITITPVDAIAQSGGKVAFNSLVILSACAIFGVISLSITLFRIYLARQALTDIPKRYIPRFEDLPLDSRRAIRYTFQRCYKIMKAARPIRPVNHPGMSNTTVADTDDMLDVSDVSEGPYKKIHQRGKDDAQLNEIVRKVTEIRTQFLTREKILPPGLPYFEVLLSLANQMVKQTQEIISFYSSPGFKSSEGYHNFHERRKARFMRKQRARGDLGNVGNVGSVGNAGNVGNGTGIDVTESELEAAYQRDVDIIEDIIEVAARTELSLRDCAELLIEMGLMDESCMDFVDLYESLRFSGKPIEEAEFLQLMDQTIDQHEHFMKAYALLRIGNTVLDQFPQQDEYMSGSSFVENFAAQRSI